MRGAGFRKPMAATRRRASCTGFTLIRVATPSGGFGRGIGGGTKGALTCPAGDDNVSANTFERLFSFLRGKPSCVDFGRNGWRCDNSGQNTDLSKTSACNENRLAWLALALSPGLGPKRILDAMQELEAPSRIFTMLLTELEGLRFPAAAAQFIFDGKARAAAEAELARVTAQGAKVVSFGCADYPERLKEIYDPPPVLWVRGDVKLLSWPAVAVVGTRHPTPYGSGMAEMLSRDLAVRRLLIVSGMARGIDSCAHRGALAARMPTVAVWGTGIDVVYPKENKKLAAEILAA